MICRFANVKYTFENGNIKKWTYTCMEFVYEDLGYKKEQVLHSTLHLVEKNITYSLCSRTFN